MMKRDEAFAAVHELGVQLSKSWKHQVLHDEDYGYRIFTTQEIVRIKVTTDVTHRLESREPHLAYGVSLEYTDCTRGRSASAQMYSLEQGFKLDFTLWDNARAAPYFDVQQAAFLSKVWTSRA